MYKWWTCVHVKISHGCSINTFMFLVHVFVSIYVCKSLHVLCALEFVYLCAHLCFMCVCMCVCVYVIVCVFVYLAVGTVATWRPLRDPWEACRRRVQSDSCHMIPCCPPSPFTMEYSEQHTHTHTHTHRHMRTHTHTHAAQKQSHNHTHFTEKHTQKNLINSTLSSFAACCECEQYGE